MTYLFYIQILTFFVLRCESARILGVFPTPSISHQIVFRPVMQELANRGHEVVVITTDPAYPKGRMLNNYEEINVHDISYKHWYELLKVRHGVPDMVGQYGLFYNALLILFQEQFVSAEVQRLLEDDSKGFDIIFVEQWVRLAMIFSYFYKVPVIKFSSMNGARNSWEEIGASVHPKFYPYFSRQRLYNVTFWEDLSEIYSDIMIGKVSDHYVKMENLVFKEIIGSKAPQYGELIENVGMTFLNGDHLWDFNRPVPRNVIYLPGVHHQPSTNLPEDLKLYLDNSNNGVIYISFGTNAKPSLLPQKMTRILFNTFSLLPYNILLKWDVEVPNCPVNVKISRWFPQSDLLKHPNIKVFITQGGIQSTDEAIEAGVPMIGIPLHFDQSANVEKCEFFKIGIKLNSNTFTEEDLKTAIDTIIEDPIYRHNIIKHRVIKRDQEYTSLQRAVWWTEHLLKHGTAAHLQAPAARMDWTEYYELDLVLLILIILVATLTLIIYNLHLIVKMILRTCYEILIRISNKRKIF